MTLWRRYPIPDDGPAQIEMQVEAGGDFRFDIFSNAWTNGVPAAAFFSWLRHEIEKVPESLRHTAELHVATFDDKVDRACIEYLRPETAEEMAERKACECREAKQQERRDREQLDRLKKKLGEA